MYIHTGEPSGSHEEEEEEEDEGEKRQPLRDELVAL